MTEKQKIFTPEQLRAETGIDEITYSTYFQTLWGLKYPFNRDENKHIIFLKDEIFMFNFVHELHEKTSLSVEYLFVVIWHFLSKLMLQNNGVFVSPMPPETKKKINH
ncbi:hypothetical protein FACS1894192_01370 [Bacilli bacterium]|nr:hypothetical protein FACS1894192_01370 [Bacilli bacterium]